MVREFFWPKFLKEENYWVVIVERDEKEVG